MAGCLSHHYWKWHLILATGSTQEKVLKPCLCHRGTSFHISVSLSGLQVPMGQLWSRRNSSLGALWVAFRLTRNWWLLKKKPVFRLSVDLKTDVSKSTQRGHPLCWTTLDMELLPSFNRWIELWGNSLPHSPVAGNNYLKIHHETKSNLDCIALRKKLLLQRSDKRVWHVTDKRCFFFKWTWSVLHVLDIAVFQSKPSFLACHSS